MASLGNGRRRRASASTHRTKYSIDFDALRGPGSDASSFADLPKTEPLDAIRSEEIDGPTDFTQNMEFWMRAPLREGSLRDSLAPTVTMPEKISDTEIAEDIEEYIGSSEFEEGQFQRQGQHDQHQNERHDVRDDAQDDDDEGSNVSSIQNQERVLSYLDTLPEADVPNIHVESPQSTGTIDRTKSVRSLQPTVEDAETTPHKLSYNAPPSDASPSPQRTRPQATKAQTITDLQEQLLRQSTESNNIIRKLQKSLAITTDELKRSQTTNEGYVRELSTVRAEHERSLERTNTEWADQSRAAKETSLKDKADLGVLHAKDKNELRGKIEALEVQMEADRAYSLRKVEEVRIDHTNELRQQRDEYARATASRDDRIATLQNQIADSTAEKNALVESKHSALTEEIERQADDLNSKVTTQEEEIVKLQKQIKDNSAAADIDMSNAQAALYQELEQERSGSKAKITLLEEQLRLNQAQLNQNDAEKEFSFLSSTEIEKDPEAKARIAELEARLKTALEQLEDLRKQLLVKDQDISQQKQQRLHVDDLYSLSQTKVADLESGMQGLRQQLDQMRNEMQIARNEVTEARELRRKEQTELDKVRSQLFTHTADSEEEREKILAKQRQLQDEINELDDEAVAKHTKHKNAMDTLRTKAEHGIKQLGETLEFERNEKFQARKEMASRRKVLAAAHDQLAQLRAEPTETQVQPAHRSHEQAEQSDRTEALVALRTALKAQQEATVSARADAAIARADLQAYKEDNDAINSAFDERIQAFMREREQKWRERLQAALKDRHSMTKALMHEWGKEECGPGNPQMYQYKYLRR